MPKGDEENRASFIDTFSVIGGNFDEAGKVSSRIKSILKKMCLPSDVVRRTAICAYEAEMNIVCYARRGKITLIIYHDHVVMKIVDEGQGIPDIDLAMQAGYSTSTAKIREMGFGAGMGLANIVRYADRFDITSEVDRGTSLDIIVDIDEKE